MTDLKRMLRQASEEAPPVVVGPHSDWLELPEHEQIYSEKAIQFVADALAKKFKHPRPGRFSPSAVGMCPRRVVFGYAGAPQLPPDLNNQEQMDHGSWTHLKWQAEGLTLGYMVEAEAWVHDERMRAGGSRDAVLHDGSLFELKTAIWQIYNRVVLTDNWPAYLNLLQTSTYMLLGDHDWASIVYEDRGGGSFHEFRVPRTQALEKEVLRLLRSYRSYVDADELPPMLYDCEMRTGVEYKRCPFREICPKSKKPSEFGMTE